MPRERVKTKIGSIHAYLVEARSIGGFSGSPVLVVTGGVRHGRSGNLSVSADRKFHILGLVHGHYGIQEIPDSFEDAIPILRSDMRNSLNMGIAIVVPSRDILAAIQHPILIAQRDAIKQEFVSRQERHLPELD
jgi:hypothetical protein